jgi:ferrous iron transport protein B
VRTVRVALAGNPNTGKSTIFNRLTGMSAGEGNYPGVTVDLCCGSRTCGEWRFEFTDLPGQYSLNPASSDEEVAVRLLLESPPDIILNVVDATNLERNLLLAIQLSALGIPMVMALNMSDEAAAAGRLPDPRILSERLGIPAVATTGRTGAGLEDLVMALARMASDPSPPRALHVAADVEAELMRVRETLGDVRSASALSSMLVEGNRVAALRVADVGAAEAGARAAAEIERLYGDPASIVLAGMRRGLASGLALEAVGPSAKRSTGPALTRRIDALLLNRHLGLPVFALVMYAAFWLTFTASGPAEELLSALFGALSSLAGRALPDGPVQSLLVDGVIGGVGGVLLYLPGITMLFLAISFMEDTGYMARAAFLTDGIMHRVGLHGRSFIPMLLGFGCTVPAVLAARSLDDRRDRLATILVLPLISCGARLPVYLLLTRAFLPGGRALALVLTYALGTGLALLGARLLRRTILRGDDSPFIMELPPYRLPTLLALSRHVWLRVRHYLAKAGTVILAFSMILWAMGYFPRPPEGAPPGAAVEHSFTAMLGRALEPLTAPLGFDWRINTALIGAAGAKELFISQMNIVLSLEGGEADPAVAMRSLYPPSTGIAVLIFVLIASPCLGTVAVVRREAGGWRWAAGQYAVLLALAWMLAMAGRWISGLLLH